MVELLAASGVTINYSGDLDPEGMSEEIVSDKRLSQLNKLFHPELKKVAEVMQREKRAGYQEAMVDLLVGDMER